MRYCIRAAAGWTASMLALNVFAQEAGTTTLGTVEVLAHAKDLTASHGALGQQTDLNTPFSTTTRDAGQIAQTQAASLAALYATDASVTRSGSDDNGYVMRGLSVRGLPVDIYAGQRINGMPTGFMFGVNLPLEMMQQVQLLKGATGFMYGFGTPGGAFNYMLKAPPEQPSHAFVVGCRSSDRCGEYIDIGGPIAKNGWPGYRLGLSHEAGTGYASSRMDRKAVSLSLASIITPSLTWKASFLAQERNLDRPPPIFYAGSYTAARLPRAIDGGTHWSASQDVNRTRFFYGTTGINWDITDRWSLDVGVSRAHTRFRAAQEYAYLLNPEGSYRGTTFDSLHAASAYAGQAILQGSADTGPIHHGIVAGLSYEYRRFNVPLANYASPVTRAHGNIYAPIPIDWRPLPERLGTYPVETTIQRALFLSDEIAFAPHWSLLLGWRFNKYWDKSATPPAMKADGTPQFSFLRTGGNVTTPTYALLYKPSSSQTLYASYVESLEMGMIVVQPYANAGTALPAMKSKQYEFGYKAQTGRWGLSAAVFRIDRAARYADAGNVYVQNGSVRYDGAEVSANVDLTPSLRVGGSFTRLDAAYERIGTSWLRGKAPAGSNGTVATIDLQYRPTEVPGLSLYAMARYVGRGIAANNADARIVVEAPAYTVVNLGAGYQWRVGDHSLTLRLNLDNAFDRRYWQVGSTTIAAGTPRTWMLNAEYRW